jgi:hypothetical protein
MSVYVLRMTSEKNLFGLVVRFFLYQDAGKVGQRRSRIAQRLGSTGGYFPFAKIHFTGERPHEVRMVPPRCGLAGRPF